MSSRRAGGGVRRSTRLWVVGGVGLLHLAAATGFVSTNVARRSEMGEAPVINLTLEPSPRFDAPTPPSVASSAAVATAAAPVSPPELKLREVQAVRPDLAPVFLPPPSPRPPSPVEGAATRETASPQSSGPASSRPSDAGATQGGGGRVIGAAAASEEDLYAARVIAWVEQNKRAPAGAASGIVTVRFVLDRRGGVRDVALVRSAGSRLLDLAALDQIRNTQPFPRPAPGTTWRTREFTLNIDYRRR